MKSNLILFIVFIALICASVAIAARFTWTQTVPDSTYGTRGTNEKLEMQKAVIAEIKTKMTNWATFTGYSDGSGRR
jgi:hypothetical protein